MNIEQTTEIATLVRQAKRAIIAANDITNSEAKAAMLCGAEHMLQAAVNMLLDARARLEEPEEREYSGIKDLIGRQAILTAKSENGKQTVSTIDISGPRA